MRERCNNPNNAGWKDYGGRGITVDPRWDSFVSFMEDMQSTWFEGGTIERDDVNGNYCNTNCKWIEKSKQGLNTRNSRKISFCGKTMCLSEWSIETGINDETIANRLERGWTIEEALTYPPNPISPFSKGSHGFRNTPKIE